MPLVICSSVFASLLCSEIGVNLLREGWAMKAASPGAEAGDEEEHGWK